MFAAPEILMDTQSLSAVVVALSPVGLCRSSLVTDQGNLAKVASRLELREP